MVILWYLKLIEMLGHYCEHPLSIFTQRRKLSETIITIEICWTSARILAHTRIFSSHVDNVTIHDCRLYSMCSSPNGTSSFAVNICFMPVHKDKIIFVGWWCSRQSLVWFVESVHMMYWLSNRTKRAWVNDKSFKKWCCFNYSVAVSQAIDVQQPLRYVQHPLFVDFL